MDQQIPAMARVSSPPTCTTCANAGTPALPLKRCSRCMNPSTQYCSRDCQAAHWKAHKKTCSSKAKPLSEAYTIPAKTIQLLDSCFQFALKKPRNQYEFLAFFQQRPEPAVLRKSVERIEQNCTTMRGHPRLPAQTFEAILRSINRSWDEFSNSYLNPSDFMVPPADAPYKIVSIAGKGRGIVASRDLSPDVFFLRESSVIVLPPSPITRSWFFTVLPRNALEAILLLHNNALDERMFSKQDDSPVSRLLDQLFAISETNVFGCPTASGNVILLAFAGSLFNHSDTPNVAWYWSDARDEMVFHTLRGVKKGDELEINYFGESTGAKLVERKREHGIL